MRMIRIIIYASQRYNLLHTYSAANQFILDKLVIKEVDMIINGQQNQLSTSQAASLTATTPSALDNTKALTVQPTAKLNGQEAPMNETHDSISHLQQARAVQSLPEGLKNWLESATNELLGAFQQEFPGAQTVNRQDVAANTNIQSLLKTQGEKLHSHPEFSPALSGKFIMSRVTSQPKGSVGEKPSDTNSGLKMGAFHTAAGLAEIICKNNDDWAAALEKHFSNVGVHNKATDPRAA